MLELASSNPQATTPSYLLDCWYQAAWSSELDDGMVARTILDVPVILFRTSDGVSALLDRCPHRFAPLSAGKVESGIVTCGYHGLAFDGAGKCHHNPHGPVTGAMKVQAFPLVEHECGVWIWMGDPEKADEALLPKLDFIGKADESARIFFHVPTAANYQLLTDNIMDLSHADYLHVGTFGETVVGSKMRVFRRDDAIVAEWINIGCEAPPFKRKEIPGEHGADFWIEVAWHAPAVMVLTVATVPTGHQREAKDMTRALHNMTPETQRSTHYFACATGSGRRETPEALAARKKMLERAFISEDKPMVEAQQARIGLNDFWSLHPVILKTDSAAVQIRRKLDEMIAAELV